MQLFCLAGSLSGRLTPRHDADIWNVELYWHFMAFTAAATALCLALFPEAMP